MLTALACLATTAAALTSQRPTAVLRSTHSQFRRYNPCRAQIAPGWVENFNEVGQPYYYNEQTGQSQWEPPKVAAGQLLLGPADGVCNEYTVRPGDEQILGRWDLVDQDPYVSRVQCVVRLAPDGTASVVSLGKPQTYILKGPRRSVILQKDETHILKDGDQIALRKNHKTGSFGGLYTVYALQDDYAQQQSAMQQGDYAQQGYLDQGFPQQDQHLPAGWTVGFDQASGATYYYNEQTCQSQWEPPQQQGW